MKLLFKEGPNLDYTCQLNLQHTVARPGGSKCLVFMREASWLLILVMATSANG